MKPALKLPSKLDSVPFLRRVALAAKPEEDTTDGADESAVSDRTGGLFRAGLVRRVSLCSRGEALGHYFWVDGVMLQQIADMLQAVGRLKCRFTHPDWCEDGTGKYLGRITGEGDVEGDQVYGDLSFAKSAHTAPDGNLATYVMDLADEDPEAFGLSIVFRHDWEAEELFEAEHTEEIELKDEEGNVLDTRKKFVSPDPLNVDNLPHARILELYAADVVDDPAANPNGLFHRQNQLATEGRGLIDFVLGRSTEAPKLSALGVAPERLRSFVSRYLAQQGLTIEELEEMPKLQGSLTKGPAKKLGAKDPEAKKLATKLDTEKKESCEEGSKDEPEKKDDKEATSEGDEEDPEKDEADDAPEEDPPADDESTEDDEEGMRSGLKGFCEMFGNERGAEYFLKAMSFTDALKAEVTTLRAQLKAANDKLTAFGQLGVDPVAFQAAPDKSKGGATGTNADGEPLSNRDKFAQANKDVVPKSDPAVK